MDDAVVSLFPLPLFPFRLYSVMLAKPHATLFADPFCVCIIQRRDFHFQFYSFYLELALKFYWSDWWFCVLMKSRYDSGNNRERKKKQKRNGVAEATSICVQSKRKSCSGIRRNIRNPKCPGKCGHTTIRYSYAFACFFPCIAPADNIK